MTPRRSQTPSQTVGPFFSLGLIRPSGNVLAAGDVPGERIRIEGAVVDGAGRPVEDALVEIWQADALGRYRHPLDPGSSEVDSGFSGFGRCQTDSSGAFVFHTVKPGGIVAPDGRPQAPHVNVVVFARGMLVHAFTRMYFADDHIEDDPVLRTVDSSRRATLVAIPFDGPGEQSYRWQIHLQGDRETVFFDA